MFAAKFNKYNKGIPKENKKEKRKKNRKYCRLGLRLFMDGSGKCKLPFTPLALV